jgi:D-3-phosphoglycerate dehydrogenase
MTKGKILIIDDLHPIFKERALEMGYDVDDLPNITRAETIDIISQYVGIAVRTKFRIDKELMEAGTQLKFVARAGAGLDNIDEELALARNEQLANGRQRN